eukprot:407913_1
MPKHKSVLPSPHDIVQCTVCNNTFERRCHTNGSHWRKYKTSYPIHSNDIPMDQRVNEIIPKSNLLAMWNLGNQCYMLSCVQCLSQCEPLKQYYLSGKYVSDINWNNMFANSEISLLSKELDLLLYAASNGYTSIYFPTSFKNAVGKLNT